MSYNAQKGEGFQRTMMVSSYEIKASIVVYFVCGKTGELQVELCEASLARVSGATAEHFRAES